MSNATKEYLLENPPTEKTDDHQADLSNTDRAKPVAVYQSLSKSPILGDRIITLDHQLEDGTAEGSISDGKHYITIYFTILNYMLLLHV